MTDTQVTLDWTPSTDNAGVTAYDVYRDGALIAPVTTATYTDTGLVAGTAYSYTITARDAAGNVSAASEPLTVTPQVSTTAWYKVVNPNSSMCVDGSGSQTANGTAVIIWGCYGGANQNWQFVQVGGYYKVVAQYAPALVWDIAGNGMPARADGAAVQLWADGGSPDLQWTIVPTGSGTYHFVNRNSGKCLDVTGSSTTAGTQLQQWSCNASVSQNFTLTVVP